MEDSLYHHELLDHYKNPRNKGKLDPADAIASSMNPSCGDVLVLSICVQKGLVHDIRFEGKGCVISQAAASLLTERSKGKSLTELMALSKDSMSSLVGISLGPTRLRCALLSLEALQRAVAFASYKESSHVR